MAAHATLAFALMIPASVAIILASDHLFTLEEAE